MVLNVWWWLAPENLRSIRWGHQAGGFLASGRVVVIVIGFDSVVKLSVSETEKRIPTYVLHVANPGLGITG